MKKFILLLGALALTLVSMDADARIDERRSWNFSVHLDDSQIGYHRFELKPVDEGVEVVSEASFDVRFLFFNAFTYRHSNRESWDGRCLKRIESTTRQNDRRFEVLGERVDGRFVLESEGQEEELESCIMTFAYWNPAFLEQPRLLNPQSGEYVSVDVEPLGKQAVTVRGETVLAPAYRVTARQTELTVWYSEDGDWLGLESVARGGRIIRYELT
jgi:hypothetical protein